LETSDIPHSYRGLARSATWQASPPFWKDQRCGVARVADLELAVAQMSPALQVTGSSKKAIEGSHRSKNRRKIKKSSIFEVRDQTFSKNVENKIDDFRKRRWTKVENWVKSSLNPLQIFQQLLLLK
jgi:hypothetical protein